MTTGLPTSRVINVSVTLTPAGASYENINTLLIIGDSDVIDTQTRLRSYGELEEVAADFGSSAPEYLAATLFFGQTPTPTQLYIGRWARTATAGLLVGAALTTTQQALSNFTTVTAGGFKIAVNGAGSPVSVTGINLSSASSLSAVASLITTALTSATVPATCTWNGSQFVFTSTTTGTSSNVSFLTPPASGTDISGLLNGTSAAGGYVVAGITAESALAAVQALDALPTFWYALSWASSVMPSDSDYLAVAAYIQATGHLQGITTAEATAITSGNTTDIGSMCEAAGYTRTFGQYSTQNPYAAAAIFGDLFTTNLEGSNTMPTVMWKVETGVVPEPLNSNIANILDAKRYNYYTPFNNGASILVNGMCFGKAFIDEIYGLDWLQNRVQTDLFNLLASVPKIPQTDAGVTQLLNCIESSLKVGVTNGLIGPGTWQAGGFGSLSTGQMLPSGYYLYAPKVSTQSPADRASRISPTIQVAVKLSGAVHVPFVLINVNM